MARDTETQRVRRWLSRFRMSPNATSWNLVSGDAEWGDRWEQAGAFDPADGVRLFGLEPRPGAGDWLHGELPMRLEVVDGPDGVEAVAALVEVLDAEWILRVELSPVGDEVAVTEMALRPRESGSRAAGGRALRHLGFGAVESQLRAWLADEWIAERLGDQWAKPVGRPGRTGRDDVHYARWAGRYVDALSASPRSPIKHLVDEAKASGEHLTEAEARWYLTEARHRKLLTSAPRGRSGGELTPKALKLLSTLREVKAEASVTSRPSPPAAPPKRTSRKAAKAASRKQAK
jgi:hypothetical protein